MSKLFVAIAVVFACTCTTVEAQRSVLSAGFNNNHNTRSLLELMYTYDLDHRVTPYVRMAFARDDQATNTFVFSGGARYRLLDWGRFSANAGVGFRFSVDTGLYYRGRSELQPKHYSLEFPIGLSYDLGKRFVIRSDYTLIAPIREDWFVRSNASNGTRSFRLHLGYRF